MLCAIINISANAVVFEYNGFTFQTIMGNRVELRIPESGYQTYGNLAVDGVITVPEKAIYEEEEYTVVQIGSSAFSGLMEVKEYVLPNTISIIESSAFFCNYALEKINFPNDLTSIGENAFFMSSLSDLKFPEALVSIGKGAFNANKNITEIILPNSVESIGEDCFISCSNVQTLSIGDGLKNIGKSAFLYCNEISSIEISAGNEFYQVKDNVIYSKDMTQLILAAPKQTGHFEMPNTVTSMVFRAMSYCQYSSIKISDNLTEIAYESINDWENLLAIVIPSSVKTITPNCFGGCLNLKYAIIGENVTKVQRWFASGTTDLEHIICFAPVPPTTEDNTFADLLLNYSTLYVPESSLELYKATAVWSKFKNIQPLSPDMSHFSPVESISFNTSSLTIEKGEQVTVEYSITPSRVTVPLLRWESSDENIVKVKNGKITGVAEGQCTITAYSVDGTLVSSSLSVNVTDEAGIEDVILNTSTPIEYYNIIGEKLSKPTIGINIVRYKDGTIKKVIVR